MLTPLWLRLLQNTSRAQRGEEEYPISIETSALPLNCSGFLLKSCLSFMLLQNQKESLSSLCLYSSLLWLYSGVMGFLWEKQLITSLLRQRGLTLTSAGPQGSWHGGRASQSTTCLPRDACFARSNALEGKCTKATRTQGANKAKAIRAWRVLLIGIAFPPPLNA